MNKRELVDAVAAATGLPRKDAVVIVHAVFDTIGSALAAGERVTISGFGTFEAVQTGPRVARNPGTGETVAVPARVRPRFRAGRGLATRVGDRQVAGL